MNKGLNIALLMLVAFAVSADVRALGWGRTVIQDGSGEVYSKSSGLFGTHSLVTQDRLGDRYINKHGLFGTSDKGVSFLGNGYEKKKGFLSSETTARDILGDSITSKKGVSTLGGHMTNVNLSGASAIAGALINNFRNGGMGMGSGSAGVTDMNSVRQAHADPLLTKSNADPAEQLSTQAPISSGAPALPGPQATVESEPFGH